MNINLKSNKAHSIFSIFLSTYFRHILNKNYNNKYKLV